MLAHNQGGSAPELDCIACAAAATKSCAGCVPSMPTLLHFHDSPDAADLVMSAILSFFHVPTDRLALLWAWRPVVCCFAAAEALQPCTTLAQLEQAQQLALWRMC